MAKKRARKRSTRSAPRARAAPSLPLSGTTFLRLAGFRPKSVYLKDTEIAALESYCREHPYELPADLLGRRRRLTFSTYIRGVLVRDLKEKKYLPRQYRMSEDERRSAPPIAR